MRKKCAKIGGLALAFLLAWQFTVQGARADIVDTPDIATLQQLLDALETLKKTYPGILDEKLAAGVSVLTEDNEYNFLPPEEAQALVEPRAASVKCGASKPVIYVEPAGGFEYRWCIKKRGESAFMDVYKYHNGVLNPLESVLVACSNNMPGTVRARVECP